MPVWIAWTIPNAIGVAGILWLLLRGCGNGWKFMVVPHKIGGVVILSAADGENHCGTRFFEIMGRIKSASKVVQKTGFCVHKTWTKGGQNACQNRAENRHYGASKRPSKRKQFRRGVYAEQLGKC